MAERTATFSPDWTSPPGDTIADIAEERGWTQAGLARRLGISQKHLSHIINGKAPVTVDTALCLERVLGSTADFWLAREANFRRRRALLEAAQRCVGWVSWLDELPVKELMAQQAIPKLRLDSRNKPRVVDACLRFFGVVTPEQWRTYYGEMELRFRRGQSKPLQLGAVSAWLRLGEIEAESRDWGPFNRGGFLSALDTIRGLTREAPDVFDPKMRQLLLDAGVLLALVPSIPGAHVSGVARWLAPTRPLLQLSLYGKTNDRFWFTFFHEAAHLLLHAKPQGKKAIFLDDLGSGSSDTPQEREANEWAANWLIRPQDAEALPTLDGQTAIEAFAAKVGVHPGIVVGRMQHAGLLPYGLMNHLKESYELK